VGGVGGMTDELSFSSDSDPGIRRRGTKRFRYIDEASGQPVRSRATLERIDALVIPPAWANVWICAAANGHIQATGRDARGRKQYRYHAAYRARREAEKFSDLVPFGEALGPLRAQVRDDLDGREWDFDHVVALVLALLDTTHIRVGNEHYVRENGTFGLTTLRNRHVQLDGRNARLHFVGKGGKEHEVDIEDTVLAKQVRRCRQLPGQLLFQWIDARGERHPVSSNDVNERLREITGLDVTAKTFRTWGASVRAAALLADAGEPASAREAKATVVAAIDEVADRLGNTRAVARASYVHPAIVIAYEQGRLPDWWRDGPVRAGHGLRPEERKLLLVLRRARRAGLGLPVRPARVASGAARVAVARA
jgi:DNA topoisomerase-1